MHCQWIIVGPTKCVFGFQVCVYKLRFVPFFFFFSCVLEYCCYCSMNSNRKCWLSAVNSVYMHCSRTHKFHFLSIFSLKMCHTSLFTHLKIILLQCFQFSVFSFSKISSIQTHQSTILVPFGKRVLRVFSVVRF